MLRRTLRLSSIPTFLLLAGALAACSSADTMTRVQDADQTTATGTFFDGDVPMDLELEAPFQDVLLFQPSPGSLSYVGETGERVATKVVVGVRGHSSIDVCRFFKLDLEVDAAAAEPTIFRGFKELKVGTHCKSDGTFDPTQRGFMSMRPDELATHREAFVYELLELLDLPSRRARPVSITYRSAGGFAGQEPGTEVTRKAFLFDRAKDVARRTATTLFTGEDGGQGSELVTNDVVTKIDLDHAAKVYLFDALVGNVDFCLPITPTPDGSKSTLHNVRLLQTAAGTFLPTPSDWNLASIVSGARRKDAELETLLGAVHDRTKSRLYNQQHHALREALALFGAARFDAARAHFVAREAALLAKVPGYSLDDEAPTCAAPTDEACVSGRANVTEHLRTFFDVLRAM